ncbi:MAG TPA: DUF2975 domain-containing protein [Micropepsaceae bacterium]|nr:DUF2975 domain-containing protein [Micropepsaceae bacterium]
MTVSKKLVTASRIMQGLSLAGTILLPALTVTTFLWPNRYHLVDVAQAQLGAPLNDQVPFDDRLHALLVFSIPTAFAIWALFALARLFALFAKGEVFSRPALQSLNSVATALLFNAIASILVKPPISFLLTHANPPGHRMMSLGIAPRDLLILFLAGTALVIARVMTEARNVADENASFV